MRLNRAVPALIAAAMAAGLALLAPPATAAPPAAQATGAPTSYTNPVSKDFADTFADPAVIRGKDGYWYAYGTTDPLTEGEGVFHTIPIARSTDLVTWDHVGDAFTGENMPTWAAEGAALWAPDIRYVDGEYRLYYVVTQTTVTNGPNDNAIGVATAPTPVGPWTDSGAPVVAPRPGGSGNADDFRWTFDPSHVVGPDGVEYLFYGSYYGGVFVTQLSEDGLRAVGEPTMVAIDNKYEGSYVVQRDGWWYLFASSANCCAGPTTGYSVHVGRSESITGPYLDREGVPLLQSRAGGTPVIAPNGSTWVGTGHNAIVTDLAGQDWIVYHAIDREDPYLDGTDGINERPMLIDRLDWIDGWPTVRAGAWASEEAETGPVTGGRTVTDFSEGADKAWREVGTWTTGQDPDSGGFVAAAGQGDAFLATQQALTHDVRVEADLRLAPDAADVPFGLVATLRPWAGRTTAFIDAAANELVLETTTRTGRSVDTTRASAPLPADFDPAVWHSVVLELRQGVARAEVSHARLGDPLAVVTLDLPERARTAGNAGAYAGGPGVQLDNLSALSATPWVTERVDLPVPGVPDAELSDEFDGTELGSGWTSVRDPDVSLIDGRLVWPVEHADLVGTGNNAGILLRDAPEGDWTVETKLTIDLGVDRILNFQQGGLIVYADDDLWARLSHAAIWNTRQTEFGTERPYAGRLQFGGTIVGPPSDTTYLRLVHRTDDAGEREVQAFTSTDGTTWVAGGVWTFPAGTDLRIGLISHGAGGPASEPFTATSQFDYFRVYQDLTRS